MWSLPRSLPRMHDSSYTKGSTYCRNASCITIPTRSQSARSSEPRLDNYIGDMTDELGGENIAVFASGGPKNFCHKTNTGKTEVKVREITLDCTARQKVNFEVICALVYLRGKRGVTGQVSVDIPYRITRNTKSKEIQTERMNVLFITNVSPQTITRHYLTDIKQLFNTLNLSCC